MKFAFLCLTVVSCANANTLSVGPQELISGGVCDIPGCNDSLSFNLQQFDPSLGTLQSVSFSFDDTSTILVFTGGDAEVTVNVQASSPFFSGTGSSTEGITCPFCQGNIVVDLVASGTTFSTSQFIGTGTSSIGVSIHVPEPSQTLDSFAHAEAEGDVASLSLQYTYTPVPEPNLSWPIGLGLLLLCARQGFRLIRHS